MCNFITTNEKVNNYTSIAPIPTTKPRFANNTNYYSILNDDDDDVKLETEEKQHEQKHNSKTEYLQQYGMLDSGTTDHFMSVHAHVENIRPTKNPLKVVIPDGSKMESTHECDIAWPALPKNATTGHIIPQLTQQSLLSVVKLCDAGCTVTFKHESCIISYNEKIVMYGIKCPRTRLWLVPLNMQQWDHSKQETQRKTNVINNIHTTTSQKELVTYLHQCFFSPPPSTLIKAIKNDQLLGVPGLTTELVKKYLPESTATAKVICIDSLKT